MAKKRKKQTSRPAAKTGVTQSPEVRETEALKALEAERYRDAITGLKALLKDDVTSERSSARRLALGEAYAGRARELTAKGMLKEALVIWENRAALGSEVPPALEHSLLCLRLGEIEPVLRQWSQREALSRAERERIGEQLAAAVLGGDESLLERLDADDLVRRHAEPARAALAAYCANEAEALGAALAQLPFRSPYRTWAALLKALTRAEEEPKAAREMLKRIDDDSAFAPLRRAAEMALLDDASLIVALKQAGSRQAELVAHLRGWSPKQLELARSLAALDTDASATAEASNHQALQRLLHGHRDLLGAEWVQQAWLRLLPPIKEQWGPRPKGWNALSGPEKAQVEAWNAEAQHNDDGWNLPVIWERFAMALADEGKTGSGHQERSLAIALALRRFDAHFKVLDTEHPDDDLDSPDMTAIEQLEHSLDWDPDHRETYLRLIRWYRHTDQLKEARRLVSAAQARWPQDMAVLEAAMQTALANHAFKKAAGLAQKMLKVDPINSGVRQQLVQAHLQHAAKQVRGGRGDLVIKELNAAREWVGRGAGLDSLRERLTWLDGVTQMLYVDRDAGRARVQEQLQAKGEGMAGRVDLMLAIELLSLRQEYVANLLELKSGKVRDRADLLAILSRLRDFLDQSEHYSKGLVDRVIALLKRAPWKQLERPELEQACETLRRLRFQAARQEAARVALKRWPHTPVFEYHLYDSKFAEEGHPSPKELERMQQALNRAQEAGEMRVANQLRELIEEFLPFGGMPMPGFGPDLDDESVAEVSAALSGALGLDTLLDALRRMPLKQALEETNMPKVMRDHFLEMAHEEGEDVVVEILEQLVFGAAATLDDAPLPSPSSGQRKGKSKKNPFNFFDLF